MRVMVRALDQANQNTQNGSAMMKVAEGAVANTIEILKTLKEKAINAATDTNTDDDRKTIQKEIDQFIDQINDNALATFNGKYLVDGSKSAKTQATATQLFNQNLHKDTAVASKLSDLKDRAGNSLNIASDDTVTITWVSQGTTTSSSTFKGASTLTNVLTAIKIDSKAAGVSVTTGSNKAFTDSAGSKVDPVSGEAGVIVTAGGTGTTNQITGFTISVVDKYGNTRKAANEFLEFKTEIFAANANDDRALKIHVGAAAGQSISIGLADMRAEALGLQDAAGNVIKVSDPKKANGAIAAFDNALQKALDQATTIGAIEARLEYTSNNLTTESENVQAAESTIRDADMAKEMTNYTKNNVLLQAAQSMLAQANQNSSAVLSLLQ
jgi:flagellin